MPSWGTIGIVLVAGFALAASPGPSMMYVLSRSISQSRAAGIASALGMAIGGMLLAVLSASGLAVLFAESRALFNTVSIVGGCYLLYLAFQLFWSRSDKTDDTEVVSVQPLSLREIVSQGIIVELLNPKTVLFFIAFLPGFVMYEQGSVWLQLIILGMLVPLTALPSDIVVSYAGGAVSGYLSRNLFLSRALEILGASILVALAVRVFITLR